MGDSNQETEVKFYLSGLPEIESRLRSFHARLVHARTHEVNLRFDHPDGDFERLGRALRLRRDDAVRLTYKDGGQLMDGALQRREIEFSVDDFDSARLFLEALGFEVVFLYEKFRTTYRMDGAEIMLDETPLGTFIEIEGPQETLKPISQKLGLAWGAAVPASYHSLFGRVYEAQHLSFHDLSFENFKGRRVSPDDLQVRIADV